MARLHYTKGSGHSLMSLGVLCDEEHYHYGYNGKLKDNEIAGLGNHYDYGARHYDPRIARWGSIDQMAPITPGQSPYSYVGDNPIEYLDVNGKFRMTNEDCAKYPDICEWLYNVHGIISVLRSPRLLELYKIYTNASPEQLLAEFTPGQGPRVFLEYFENGKEGEYRGNVVINQTLFDFYAEATDDEERMAALFSIAFEIEHEEAHRLSAKNNVPDRVHDWGDHLHDWNNDMFIDNPDTRNMEFTSADNAQKLYDAALKIVKTFPSNNNYSFLPQFVRNPNEITTDDASAPEPATIPTNAGNGASPNVPQATHKQAREGRRATRKMEKAQHKHDSNNKY